MKKLIIVLFIGLLMPVLNSYAQTLFKGKIIDKNNNPVLGATVVSILNKNKGTATDVDGNFNIQLTNPEVEITSVGFQSKKVKLVNGLNTIVLVQASENLEEVIVSASREAQQRSEIPGAIGVLTASQIEETKAFGIDQIVNQVPGVNMTSSKASGNEQHAMSIRSPISYKSLFLYLEDGLPIRPVAVFNHNALLEMNSTAFGRVEILKGPASSIYGSEAIGGSINFITKDPSKEFEGSLGAQINTMGLSRFEADASVTANEKYGFYIGAHYVQRKNGPVEYSDYEKTAISFKNVNTFSETLKWTNTVSFIDYRSDMSGSVYEDSYLSGEYESDQTFTERVARSLRFRSTLDKRWNENNKTSFNYSYRNNIMDQIPSYRVNQDEDQDDNLTGTATGEINSNKFKSYVGLVQHKMNFDFADASLIIGGTIDYSPQSYVAESIDIIVDVDTGKNISYTVNEGDYNLFYEADIFNYAGYAQFEISPIEKLKFTGAIRYDAFSYDYDNLIEDLGVDDTKITYTNVSPKLGFNYNFSNNTGIYGNYSKGFTPPQTSTLFRNSKSGSATFDLKPAKYNNFEVGGYFTIPSKLKVDLAVYQLDGKDRLITTYDDNGDYLQVNAGKTQSRGVELGIKYNFLDNLWIDYNGTYASHRYIEFFVYNTDYSDTEMAMAPNYLANTSINYKPLKNLLFTLEHEQIGAYNMSYEDEIVTGTDNDGNNVYGEEVYDGHNVFNFRANYSIGKFDVWGQVLNVFDELYAVTASYSYGKNSYTIGNPRGAHFGIRYNF